MGEKIQRNWALSASSDPKGSRERKIEALKIQSATFASGPRVALNQKGLTQRPKKTLVVQEQLRVIQTT